MNLSDFDTYVDDQFALGNNATLGELFGQWLSNIANEPIIGGPANEPPTFITLPEEDQS